MKLIKGEAFLLHIKPARFDVQFDIIFDVYPTKEMAIEAITKEIKAFKFEKEFEKVYEKELLEACTNGLKVWGIPKRDLSNTTTYQHWKFKGESAYSSKGLTAIKVFPSYKEVK